MIKTCAAVLAAMVFLAGCMYQMPPSGDGPAVERGDGAAPPAVAPPAHQTPQSTPPAASAVMAGWADDNAQYNYYLRYLDQFSNVRARKLDVSDRVMFTALDKGGRSLHGCEIAVKDPRGVTLAFRRTYADGRAMLFPHELPGAPRLKVEARCGQRTIQRDLTPGENGVELRFDFDRPTVQQVPLDVAFVLDTTSSMSGEIDKLKAALGAIQYQITQLKPAPQARFGMVLYRDRGDQYVTKVVPFTDNMQDFAKALAEVAAAGGGDTPEDMQEGLRAAAQELAWRPEAVKMAFVLSDAPPHLDYGEAFGYVEFMRHCAAAGIKATTIGASGLDKQGEYIFRQISQYTMGLFVFLTHGEHGDSGADTPWTVSHHTGANWQTRNLDAIIVQAVAAELSHLTDKPVEAPQDYFQARPAAGVAAPAVLDDLFAQCARQLVDFSQVKLPAGSPAAVLPVKAGEDCAAAAGGLGERLGLALGRDKTFKLVEREGLQQVMHEMDLEVMNSFDAKLPPQGGKQTAAKFLVMSKLLKTPGQYEMFVKMVSVQTGEVVSATMMKIDPALVGG